MEEYKYFQIDVAAGCKDGRNEDCYVSFSCRYMSAPWSYCLHVEERYESGTHVYSHGHNWKSYYTKEAAVKDLNAMRKGFEALASVNITTNLKKEIKSTDKSSRTGTGFTYEEYVKYSTEYERTKLIKVYVSD